jgi:DNA-binding NarL/FixJ family response regulator
MPLTILVVDDDSGVRLCVGDFLSASGYSVVLAENGQEALLRLAELQPHLIVTDVAMPLMDGYELVRRVRQQPTLRLLPVIFLTERSQTKERIRGYQLGCDIYLPKPFDLQELGVVVRNLLERSQLIQTAWQYTYQDQLVQQPFVAATSSSRSATQVLASDVGGHKRLSTNTFVTRLPEPTINRPSPTCADLPFPLQLTDREAKVLALVVDGLSNNQIGDRLYLSPRTVEKYVSNLLRKTTTSNRAELVHFAMKHCLVNESSDPADF